MTRYVAHSLSLLYERIHARPAHYCKRIAAMSIPEPNTGCWLWLASVTQFGYGTITVGRALRAHRVSWIAFRGAVSDGLHVLHRCDTRCCVNPDHLFLGTNSDNVADKVAKGRQARTTGAAHYAAKLTDTDIIDIRASTWSLQALAAHYGVAKSSITSIRSGRTWSAVPGNLPSRRPKPLGELQGTAKLTVEIVQAVRIDSRPQSKIAASLGISQSTISRIKSREIWPHVA